MELKTLTPYGFASNTYLLTNERGSIVVDPGEKKVVSRLKELGVAPDYVLLTHAHFDHVGGVAVLQRQGAKVGCLAEEAPYMIGGKALVGFGLNFETFTPDFTFGEGEIELLGEKIFVYATPGHTVGGCVYLIDGKLFTGDTLFRESYGRTDLPTGDTRQLFSSLKKLLSLQGDYPVYPGHGEPTALSHERKFYS